MKDVLEIELRPGIEADEQPPTRAQPPTPTPEPEPAAPPPAGCADPEPETLVFQARRRIVFRCGQSSLTLHANGKIELRGESILSDAEGVNRLAGGQIQLN